MQGFFPSSRVQQERPATGLVPKCGACGLYKTCESPKMPAFGNGRRRVLVVGEAPGQTEDEEGRPFLGKAGKFLRQCLQSVGVDLDRDAWTTNSLICRPPSNATPDNKQIGYCQPNLVKTIRRFQPNAVLTLGRSALASVLTGVWRADVGPLERWTGWHIPSSNHWIYPTWHPSYLLRMNNPFLEKMFIQHLEQAFFGHTEPPPVQEDYKSKIQILLEPDLVEQQLEEIDRLGGWVAVDYEGNCLKPEYPKGKIVSLAVSNGDVTISFPWFPEIVPMVGRFLLSKRTKKIASNLKHEERWTRKVFGHGVKNWGWDTMLAAHCLDNRTGICSLKFQATVRLGVPTYNEHIEPYLRSSRGNHYNQIHQLDLRELLLYGGMDALLEHRLAMVQRKDMGYAS